MRTIFKIGKYNEDTNSISVKFCRLHSTKSIDDYSSKLVDLENASEDLVIAARHALIQMIDYLVNEHGLTKEQAYVLCSVAADLRVGQVVDVPNYVVTAVLALDVFDKYRN